MPSLKLTSEAVKALKGQSKQIDYNDQITFGLSLRVSTAGTKTWTVRYYPLGSTQQKRKTIGYFLKEETGDGHMSLASARAKALEIQQQKKEGKDPAAEAKAAKDAAKAKLAEAAAEQVTLTEGVEAFLKVKLPDCKDDAARKAYRYYYDSFIVPGLGPKTPVRSITYQDIEALLQRKMDEGKGTTANRARDKINVFFNWAVSPRVRMIDTNPASAVEELYDEEHNAVDKRNLDNAELKFLLREIARTKDMDAEVKLVLQLMCYTGRRPKELCGVEIAFIKDWDSPNEHINFPAALMKGQKGKSKAYVLPLAPAAKELVACAIHEWRRNGEIAGAPSKYLFRTQFRNQRGDVPITANSVAQAMKRMIDNLKVEGPDADVIQRLKVERPTPYSFRRTIATGMARQGAKWEDRKAVLGHHTRDVMTDHYDAYDRMPEKRHELQQWENHVLGLLREEVSTGVIQFKPLAEREKR